MKALVALNGIHTSGKTTVGRSLAERGYTFIDEIAGRIIREGGADFFRKGSVSDDDFQRRVMQLEMQRDEEILAMPLPVVVETYHTGNLAHAYLVASPETVAMQERHLVAILHRTMVEAVFLRIKPSQIRERSKLYPSVDEKIIDFYTRLEDNFFRIYQRFEIPFHVVENQEDFRCTVDAVERIIAA